MVLRKKPTKPKSLPMTAPSWALDKVPALWLPYLDVQSSAWATAGIGPNPVRVPA